MLLNCFYCSWKKKTCSLAENNPIRTKIYTYLNSTYIYLLNKCIEYIHMHVYIYRIYIYRIYTYACIYSYIYIYVCIYMCVQ